MRRAQRRNVLGLTAGALAMCGLAVFVQRSSPLRAEPREVRPGGKAEQVNSASFQGPLRAHKLNPRYFTDGSGRAVYLTGIQFEDALREDGTPVPTAVEYAAFLDTVSRYNLNYVRLWRWSVLFRYRYEDEPFATSHMPWKRTGPGAALDGRPRFNLTQFDPAYFDRLRSRVKAAADRGFYVSVMLFEGHALRFSKPPWRWGGHPFNKGNNVNGVDGDPDGDGTGLEVHTLKVPAVTAVQVAYVRKVVDTLNDLDNVLYEVSNETGSHSTEWQYHVVRFVHDYEHGKPKQHPVGMSFQYPGGTNRALFDSPADWVAPGGEYEENPPAGDGKKVILCDTDHLGGKLLGKGWVWQSFMRGLNPINYGLMGLGSGTDKPAELEQAARAMGQTRWYAERINLAAMKPAGSLTSTQYCLANPGREYLVYQPRGGEFTVELANGTYSAEWFDTDAGTMSAAEAVSGGARRRFKAPFGAPAVLQLKAEGAKERADAPPGNDRAGARSRQEAKDPPFRTLDLDRGEVREVELADGRKVNVKLLEVQEERDALRSAIRRATIRVEIDGAAATVSSGNYQLPVRVGDAQIDCPVTKGYYEDHDPFEDSWGLVKDARVRLWPKDSPWLEPGTFAYPVKQRWFATPTQMGNEPSYVDGGDRPQDGRRIYYHSGNDIGGCEGMVDVVSACDGVVASAGGKAMPEYSDAPFYKPRGDYDYVYVVDARGWFYRYAHLQLIDPAVRPGGRVTMGQKIGVLGKEGSSGGWAHLHFDIKAKQPSGKWGVQDAYPFLWEAYRREHKPKTIAVARPHHLAAVGERVTLDGSRSWSAAGRVVRYRWTFGDGTKAEAATAERTYDRPGSYSEVLEVTDAAGQVDYDFAVVQVLDKDPAKKPPPTVHAAYAPTFGIRVGDPVTFKVRTFRTEAAGDETWDFGDGTERVTVHSGGSAKEHDPEGYATTTHRFQRAGHYIVRVEGRGSDEMTALGHLQVRVAERQ